MRRTQSDFLGTFVSIDKSAPSGADGRKDIVHGANQSDSIKETEGERKHLKEEQTKNNITKKIRTS